MKLNLSVRFKKKLLKRKLKNETKTNKLHSYTPRLDDVYF